MSVCVICDSACGQVISCLHHHFAQLAIYEGETESALRPVAVRVWANPAWTLDLDLGSLLATRG